MVPSTLNKQVQLSLSPLSLHPSLSLSRPPHFITLLPPRPRPPLSPSAFPVLPILCSHLTPPLRSSPSICLPLSSCTYWPLSHLSRLRLLSHLSRLLHTSLSPRDCDSIIPYLFSRVSLSTACFSDVKFLSPLNLLPHRSRPMFPLSPSVFPGCSEKVRCVTVNK